MQRLLRIEHRSDALLLAMMWLATTAMLRISEFTVNNREEDRVLSLSQLTFVSLENHMLNCLMVSPSTRVKHAILHLLQSKSDPFRTGVDIVIATPETLAALRRYLLYINPQGKLLTDPLFTLTDNKAVNRQWFMRQVSALLTKAGYNTLQYSSHSFRKGGAVSLQHGGAPDSVIRKMGRWRSDAFHLYVRDPIYDTIIEAAKQM